MHGRVANTMWKPLLEQENLPRIRHVTNGIHVPTWLGPEVMQLIRSRLGAALDGPEPPAGFAEAVEAIPGHELWTAHMTQKHRLIALTREKTLEQFARHGRPPSELRRVDEILDPAALTIGFARRFATYKRADLMLRDEPKLRELVRAQHRPVQLIFSGKAHPADRPGQDLIRRISQAALSAELRGRVIFLENYDFRVARHLVQGVDLWLNTPRRPLEASGTSGMKAAVNGVLNCSILDGWWCEGYDPSHGWVIGGAETAADEGEQDRRDTEALYRVLLEEVVPLFYARDEQGLPAAWIRRMKRAIASLAIRFGAARMVREYVEGYYLPAARGEPAPAGS
jgi:starch phosphorylase